MSPDVDVIIVGAGLAGLACAGELERAGVNYVLIEANDRVGGRLKTDIIDGFHLDHGFIVLTTSYIHAQSILDYDALRLGYFHAGAHVFSKGRFYSVFDPFRHPSTIWQTLTANIGTFKDKLKILKLRKDCAAGHTHSIAALSTQNFIDQRKFSSEFIEQFLRPFYGGIFLEHALETSAEVFAFTFDRFAHGQAAIPREGIEAIPRQMYARLPPDKVKLNTTVDQLMEGRIRTTSGEYISGKQVVLATPAARDRCFASASQYSDMEVHHVPLFRC